METLLIPGVAVSGDVEIDVDVGFGGLNTKGHGSLVEVLSENRLGRGRFRDVRRTKGGRSGR